ncbi:N-acetylmuramoyl-L-alanine amidase [Nocardioides sp. C4-1]|uniref:N-acetylmuramoyl-L-alanine amidase n=1 Tax=Nocardioides sp. C4-1 TaxID=3151851 RepID=UPI003266639F
MYFPRRPRTPDDTRDASSPSRIRFVTTCQQLLVLGVILAVLTPAANVISIDFGPAPERADGDPGTGAAELPQMSMAAYSAVQQKPVAVPTAPVDPVVREVPLTAPAGARVAPGRLAVAKATVGRRSGTQRIVSTPQKVTGYGAVGLTWQHGTRIADDQIKVKVRTQDARGWSKWTKMEYHDEHGPDPDSKEGRRARPGTDELLVGTVAHVQVKVVTKKVVPADLKLAVIDPGVATATAKQLPAIDTASLGSAADRDIPADTPADSPNGVETSDGEIELAAKVTPKPTIYSRAQWGADERLRDPGSLRYFEVHAGFVHHTVNANNYQAADVPAILRGIYAYHTKSRGWSDVGYNYLVDRFGRIWEGRAGGVDRPVVGAHTLGYNDDSFAMSAIGNFETAQPTSAMVQAYGALFAWKLALHGVNAASTRQFVTSRNFQAINGHRDAGSTACPGKYLYAKLPQIRALAAGAQVGFAGRQLRTSLVPGPVPDLVVRRRTDGQGFVVPLNRTAGKVSKRTPIKAGLNLSTQNLLLNAGDWNGDGKVDIITRRTSDGVLAMRPGLGNGRFGPAVLLGRGFNNVELLAAVGDVTGDGKPDLMGQPRGSSMRIYPGRGATTLGASYVAYSRITASAHIAGGLWDGDGAPDSLMRVGNRLVLYTGNGPGGFTGKRTLSLDVTPYDQIRGVSDVNGDGHTDLLVRRTATGELLLITATATGFGRPVSIGTGYNSFDLIG